MTTDRQHLDMLVTESKATCARYGEIIDQAAPWTDADNEEMNFLAAKLSTLNKEIRELTTHMVFPNN